MILGPDTIFLWELCPLLNLEIWPKLNILLKQFVSSTPLEFLNRISSIFLVTCMKDILCMCAYSQEILRKLAKIKFTTETGCQRNSSESDRQNFVNLCIYEGNSVQIFMFAGYQYFILFFVVVGFHYHKNSVRFTVQ